MLIGMMNDPSKEVKEELKFAGEAGFDFLDLTVEPPKAKVEDIEVEELVSLCKKYKLKLVGHTSFDLQWASPVRNVYKGTFAELENIFALFERLKVKKVTLHPHWFQPNSPKEEIINRNIESLRKIVKLGEKYSLKVLLENVPNGFLSYLENFQKIFQKVENLGFHLDVGHCAVVALRKGVQPEKEVERFLRNLGDRLSHVHLSDVKKEDDHLPLGAGIIDWKKCLELLKKVEYNDTITLEIFVKDREYLILSKRKIESFVS